MLNLNSGDNYHKVNKKQEMVDIRGKLKATKKRLGRNRERVSFNPLRAVV